MMMLTLLSAMLSTASARPSPALLEVDNDFEGEVEVFVDGHYEGTVAGDRALRMDVQPGRRDVRVQRPRGGAVLLSTALHFQRGVISGVEVHAPLTRLRVVNAGTMPLSVDLGPGDDVWIAPSSSAELRVVAGTVDLVASASDRDGMHRVHSERIWVEPGAPAEHVLRYTPPPPTRLALTNPSFEPLRALVDGREVGWVSPGASQLVLVDPGRTQVRFYDRRGRLVSAMDVRAERGEKTRVVAVAAAPPPHRPTGPVRVTSSSCSGGSRTVAMR